MATISTTPWSNFSDSDYSLEQLITASLINLNTGPRSGWTKGNLKLRVREPDGTLNRGGIIAAGNVLAGARGGVDAPPAAKRAAARTLIGMYAQIKLDPPDSVRSMAA
jgi:hypothetical protein